MEHAIGSSRSVNWDRVALIQEVRNNIWRYLTPSSNVENQLLEASALLQLSPNDILRLGQTHFILSQELEALLLVMPTLIRRLATTTVREEEYSSERVRGRIQWNKTLGLRAAGGSPNLYVTAPAHRAYQTPENELLVFLLDEAVKAGKRLGWQSSDAPRVGQIIKKRVEDCERWLQTRMLAEVERAVPTPMDIARVRTGRLRIRYGAALSLYERYLSLVGHFDAAAIRSIVENQAIVVLDDPTLFELVCTFRLIDILRDLGWAVSPLGLFAGSLRLTANRDGEQLTMYYQATPLELRQASLYRQVQSLHALAPSSLRPDLVLKHLDHGHDCWILVEIKGGYRSCEDSARAALSDLLAYRDDYRAVLHGASNSVCLGIAWGRGLQPARDGSIILCTPDTLPNALAAIMDPTSH